MEQSGIKRATSEKKASTPEPAPKAAADAQTSENNTESAAAEPPAAAPTTDASVTAPEDGTAAASKSVEISGASESATSLTALPEAAVDAPVPIAEDVPVTSAEPVPVVESEPAGTSSEPMEVVQNDAAETSPSNEALAVRETLASVPPPQDGNASVAEEVVVQRKNGVSILQHNALKDVPQDIIIRLEEEIFRYFFLVEFNSSLRCRAHSADTGAYIDCVHKFAFGMEVLCNCYCEAIFT